MSTPRTPSPPWSVIAGPQEGIISRSQLLALGLSSAGARTNLDNGRWQSLLPGVYATFTGPLSPLATTWAAVLYGGNGAVASHRTALWLGGAIDSPTDSVHIAVPASRRILRQPGIRIHLSRGLGDPDRAHCHPSASPPRTRLEVSLLDQCDLENSGGVVHLALQTIQRRLTTANRLQSALAARPRHRWRSLLLQVLTEARDGVASPLELAYRRGVERGHGLPQGVRNLREAAAGGGNQYRDVRYPRWRVVVELDGREAHPVDQAFRDLRRDNLATVARESALRYGWRDVIGKPCEVAAQVALVLTNNGWPGRPQACASACPAPRPATPPHRN